MSRDISITFDINRYLENGGELKDLPGILACLAEFRTGNAKTPERPPAVPVKEEVRRETAPKREQEPVKPAKEPAFTKVKSAAQIRHEKEVREAKQRKHEARVKHEQTMSAQRRLANVKKEERKVLHARTLAAQKAAKAENAARASTRVKALTDERLAATDVPVKTILDTYGNETLARWWRIRRDMVVADFKGALDESPQVDAASVAKITALLRTALPMPEFRRMNFSRKLVPELSVVARLEKLRVPGDLLVPLEEFIHKYNERVCELSRAYREPHAPTAVTRPGGQKTN